MKKEEKDFYNIIYFDELKNKNTCVNHLELDTKTI